mgnify:FL=1
MESKIISVVIPVYNQEKYIERCLRSVLNQNIDDDLYDIVVVNDGSTDNSLKILKKYSDKINLINYEKNIGLPGALNKGIQSCKSKYVVRVDSDDYVNNNFLNFLFSFISFNEVDAVACDYFLVDEDENVIDRKNCDTDPIGCGIMFQYDHLINLGLYNERFLINEEIEFRNRFIKNYKIKRLEVPLYRYRQHDTNITKDKKKKKYDDLLKTYE